MLWWGASNKFFNLGSVGLRHCPICEKDRNFSTILTYRLHHIWFLIRWITSKTYTVACDVCLHGAAVEPQEIEAAATKHPVPSFDRFGWAFGLGGLALLIGVGGIAANEDTKQNKIYAHTPHVGDIYKLDLARLSSKPEALVMYSAARVKSIKEGVVGLQTANGFYNKRKGVDDDVINGKALEDSYYAELIEAIPVAQIERMTGDGTIWDIERN